VTIRIAEQDYVPKEYFIKSEIILAKKLINWQDISSLSVQHVARDAFYILKMCVLTRKHLTHQAECVKN
jgi:hypothetical protein